MSWLLDTNVLLRLADAQGPEHAVAEAAIERLLAGGESVFISAQSWAPRLMGKVRQLPAFVERQREMQIASARSGLPLNKVLILAMVRTWGRRKRVWLRSHPNIRSLYPGELRTHTIFVLETI